MSSRRGRYTLVTFLYTHCPDVCPLIAEHLNTALRQLGPERKGVSVLAVSVDPKGDTPAAVKQLRRRPPPPAPVPLPDRDAQPSSGRSGAAYHVAADPEHGTTAVAHSAFVLLVDRQGVERLLYDSNVKAGDIVHDIDVLKEK